MRKLRLYEWSKQNELKIYISNIYIYIFSLATLNETFMAKYDGVMRSPPLPPRVLEFQAAHILHAYLTQKDKTWKRQRKPHSKIF